MPKKNNKAYHKLTMVILKRKSKDSPENLNPAFVKNLDKVAEMAGGILSQESIAVVIWVWQKRNLTKDIYVEKGGK